MIMIVLLVIMIIVMMIVSRTTGTPEPSLLKAIRKSTLEQLVLLVLLQGDCRSALLG